MGVLPARSARCQNALAEYVPIFCRGCSPVLSDRAPSFTKAYFVCVPILRNNGGDSLRVRHRQTETGRRSIIEHVNCIAVDLERLRESVDRERQSIEGVRIFSFRWHFCESETRKVWRDHAVVASQARNEFAEHERRGWESVQQENYGRVCFAGTAVKHLHAVGFDLVDGSRRQAKSRIVLARRWAFRGCS